MVDAERLICDGKDLIDSGAGVRFEVIHYGRSEPAFAIRFKGRVFAYLNRCTARFTIPTPGDVAWGHAAMVAWLRSMWWSEMEWFI